MIFTALATYEPRIKSKIDLFLSQLKAPGRTSVNITDWSMFLSFDVMGEVGFSKDFDNLATGNEHPAIKGIHDHMLILGILSNVPWLLNIISSIPGAAAGYTGFFNWCSNETEEIEKASLIHIEFNDMLTDLIRLGLLIRTRKTLCPGS